MDVVASALWYNAALAIGQLQQQGALAQFFQTWHTMIFATHRSGNLKHFKRPHHKKVCSSIPSLGCYGVDHPGIHCGTVSRCHCPAVVRQVV